MSMRLLSKTCKNPTDSKFLMLYKNMRLCDVLLFMRFCVYYLTFFTVTVV